MKAVRICAKAQGVRSPRWDFILGRAFYYQENSGLHSVETTAKDVLADWLENEIAHSSTGTRANDAGSGSVVSLVLAVAFKSVVERFREEVWETEESQGEVKPPFQDQDAACVWLELIHRLEEKSGCYPDSSFPPIFSLSTSDSRPKSWPVPAGGILQKLFEFCHALASASGWWGTDSALKFVLLGLLPAPVRVQPEGSFGNYARGFTITINGPITEEALIKAYRRGCEAAHITPQGLSRTHYRLLFLVHYLMPNATWPQRFRQWLEWGKVDETLPSYGATLREDGSVENPEGYKNLKSEFRRAMDRQSWTDEVPQLLRPKDFESYWSPRRAQMTVKAPPPHLWEQPEFDASDFEHPYIDLRKLEALCLEAQKINPYPRGITTFWKWYDDNGK